MSPVKVLVKAYYERLYERMARGRARLVARIDRLLPAEIDRQGFGPMGPEGLEAYRQACHAFVDERIETYNPIGIQYTFDRRTSSQAAELEFELNWYDSRAEFEELVTMAKVLAPGDVPDEALGDLTAELISQVGAFPDRSIIAGYAEQPALQKLPDFIVACAIEQVICERQPDIG